MFKDKTILITGVACFIGSRLSKRLLKKGQIVIGFDILNDYYDVSLKESFTLPQVLYQTQCWSS